MILCHRPECKTTAGCRCNEAGKIDPVAKWMNAFAAMSNESDALRVQVEALTKQRDAARAAALDECEAIARNYADTAKDEEIARLREALTEIAKQMLVTEMDADQSENADFEFAYGCCVHRARAALDKTGGVETK